MSKGAVHVIGNITVNDAGRYQEYEKGFFPILKRHGGELLTYDDHSLTFEGDAPPNGRLIILKFPDQAAAESWYHDPEYQTLSAHRRASTQLHFLTMVHSPAA